MSYLIKRLSDGAYVSRPQVWTSYTRRLEDARRFSTHKEAERDRCGNEVVVELERELDMYRRE